MTKRKKDQPSPLEKRVEELETLAESLQSQVEDAKEGQVRALADLENFRRRQSQSQASWTEAAIAGFFKKMTPNLLELSLGALHSADETAKRTIDKFFADLGKHGFTKIEPVAGEPVDAERHEVLMAEEGEPGAVVRCLEIGWEFNGQVITPAKVSASPQ